VRRETGLLESCRCQRLRPTAFRLLDRELIHGLRGGWSLPQRPPVESGHAAQASRSSRGRPGGSSPFTLIVPSPTEFSQALQTGPLPSSPARAKPIVALRRLALLGLLGVWVQRSGSSVAYPRSLAGASSGHPRLAESRSG